jgi:hypothetical protein
VLATVLPMSPDKDMDPGASTQMFRAFVERSETDRAEEAGPGNRLLVAGLLIAVIVAVVVGALLLG